MCNDTGFFGLTWLAPSSALLMRPLHFCDQPTAETAREEAQGQSRDCLSAAYRRSPGEGSADAGVTHSVTFEDTTKPRLVFCIHTFSPVRKIDVTNV